MGEEERRALAVPPPPFPSPKALRVEETEGEAVGVEVGVGLSVALAVAGGEAVADVVAVAAAEVVGETVLLVLPVVLGDTVGVGDGEGQEGPPGQGTQVAFPGAAHALSGQHAAAPAPEYRPVAQAVQAEAPAGLKVPAAHSAGCAVLLASVALQAEPAGQGSGSEPHR
jgi:hypothetical protein